jgi:hypothetical protein
MAGQDIVLKIGANLDAFRAGLSEVKKQTNDLGADKWQQFKQAFTVAAIVEGLRELGQSMVELRRSAQDKGASTDFLQGMRKATERFGGTAEDADTALDKLLIKIGEAREQGGAAAEGFTRFGIALKTVDGFATTTEEVFRQIADRYKESEDPARRAAIANEFFAKSGLRINNVLEMGASGLDDYIGKLKESGRIVDSGKVNALADAYMNVNAALKTGSGQFAQWAGAAAQRIGLVAAQLGALWAGATASQADAIARDQMADAKREEMRRQRVEQAKREAEELRRLAAEARKIQNQGSEQTGEFRSLLALSRELALRFEIAKLPEVESKKRAALEKQIVDAIAGERAIEIENENQRIENAKAEVEMRKQTMEELRRNGADIIKQKEAELEVEKAQNELGKARLDVRKRENQEVRELMQAQSRATGARESLEKAKGDRLKFSAEEFRRANLRGISDPQLRSDLLAFRESESLKEQADAIRNSGRAGWKEEAAKLFNKADAVRAGITSLSDSDRFPFKALEDGVKESNKLLDEINAKTGQPPKFGTIK